MDLASIGLVIAIIVLVMFSAFFSATETAFSSMSRIKLKSMAQDGNKKAKKALLISKNYDNFLTTILIGNNVVNILAATLSTVLFTSLVMNGELAVTLSTIVMTVVMLIFGEISPKSLAKEVPEKFAMAVAPVIQFFLIILTPISWVFAQWKKLLVIIFKPKAERGMNEQELMTIVDEATTGGEINEEEGELIKSAIEFNEIIVRDIFTPRVDVIAADINSTKDELRALFAENGFSRMPIYDGDIDHIVGILHEKDFYQNYFNEVFDIKAGMSNIVCVTLNSMLNIVLKMLQKSKTHMAVVIDEYGGTTGIVTLEDILEELVGEIWDEHDEITEEIISIGDNEYQINGNADIEDLFDRFKQKYDSDELEVVTVSGWVVDQFGYIPKVGETLNYNNLFIKVLDADSRKIEKIYLKVGIKVENDESGFFDKLFMKEERSIKENETKEKINVVEEVLNKPSTLTED